MEMSGEFRIPAPREKVWAALNDPEILKQSVPGCQSITRLSDTEMEGAVTASVGPVKAMLLSLDAGLLEKELGPFLNGDVRSTACREHLKSFAAKHAVAL